MSELVTNKITPGTGSSDTVTLGDSGDTFSIPSGATIANSGTATGFLPAAGTSGNVLTSNGSDWASSTPATPASAGTPNVVTYSSQSISHGTTTHLIAAIQSSSGTHGYNASTGIWTCPSDGLWLYAPQMYIYGGNAAVECEVRVVTAQIPGGQSGMWFPGDQKFTSAIAYEVNGSCALLFQATVGDTAYVNGYQNSGATWTADVVHNICRLGD